MATIFIDNKPYEVRDGLNLLQACLELGENLPYFCWHPAMGSVGACRQCAIKQFRDENDTKGRIVMACMTPAANNTRISLADKDAREFRQSITEWLMTNHPHDCPVCDEGGECHLQDMTLMTGHDYRRYRFKKRTFENQNLGPFVNHEMNRCIQCYRCVRFYRDYAGGKDLHALTLHDTVYFGRSKDGTLESEFSGNLVEICPTGVFTDKTLKKHYTRKWDLTSAPSVCVGCAVGCNIFPQERYGTLRRIRNRYNGDVNGYFLCDRGRYGYEFVNAPERLTEPRIPNRTSPITRDMALSRLGELLAGAKKVIGIGSPRASLESNFALRTLVGAENFYQGIPENERRLTAQIIGILQRGPARSASLHDIATSDAVLILGEDVSNSAPMLALALRQAVRQQPLKKALKLRIPAWDDYSVRQVIQKDRGPLFMAVLNETRIDDIASLAYRAAPQDLARLGFAVAHELAPDTTGEVEGLSDALRELAKGIAEALKAAEHPLVISGTGCGSDAVIRAAADVAAALCVDGKVAGLSYVVPEANSMGAGLIGGESLDAAVQAAQGADVVIVLENDLFRRASPAQVDQLFQGRHVIALDHLNNPTVQRAEIALPAGTFAEASGTLVNHEGRAQRFYQVFEPKAEILESWRWIKELLSALKRPEAARWRILDDLQAHLAEALPVFKPVTEIAPPAEFRMAGQKVARQSARFSGRTAMNANVSVHEPDPPEDPDTPMTFTMEGLHLNPPLQPPPALIPRFWAPGWNSIQSLNKFQSEINGPLRGGNPGCRLIEPGMAGAAAPEGAPSAVTPLEFEPHPGEWLAVPLYHVFGSDELSMLTPGVAERAPRPYLALNPEDAAALAGTAMATTGTEVTAAAVEAELYELKVGDTLYRLPLRISPALPRGLVGLPVGLPGLPFAVLPALGSVSRAEGGN